MRSFVTLAAIAFGAAALILAGGFFQDTFLRMREGLIHSHLGHIQIYKKGYSDHGTARPFEYLIESPDRVSHALSSMAHVQMTTPRISFSGLLSTGENTLSVMVQGVDPDGESRLARIEGIRHADTGFAILEGTPLSNADPFGVLLGQGLARSAGLSVGDSVIILTNTVAGSLNAFDLTVRGIFGSPSKEFDDRGLRMTLETAQRLLRTDAVESLIVLLRDTKLTDVVLHQVRRDMGETFSIEAKPWYDLADFYNRVVALYRRQFAVLIGIIAVIVVLSVFNTVNMSITERTREIGTIMALGFRPSEVRRLFMLEGLLMGLLGGVLGLLLGMALAHFLSVVGIPMPPPPGGSVEWKAAIKIVPELLFMAFGVAALSAFFSSLYPAWKASRLVIADALRHT